MVVEETGVIATLPNRVSRCFSWAFSRRAKSAVCCWMACIDSETSEDLNNLGSSNPWSRMARAKGVIQRTQSLISGNLSPVHWKTTFSLVKWYRAEAAMME